MATCQATLSTVVQGGGVGAPERLLYKQITMEMLM